MKQNRHTFIKWSTVDTNCTNLINYWLIWTNIYSVWEKKPSYLLRWVDFHKEAVFPLGNIVDVVVNPVTQNIPTDLLNTKHDVWNWFCETNNPRDIKTFAGIYTAYQYIN